VLRLCVRMQLLKNKAGMFEGVLTPKTFLLNVNLISLAVWLVQSGRFFNYREESMQKPHLKLE